MATPHRAHRSGAAFPFRRRSARPSRRRALGDPGHQLGLSHGDQRLASFERALCAPGGPADERVEPGQGPAVLALRPRRQLRDRLVGRDGESLDLDQVLVELVDEEAGVGVVREGCLDSLGRGLRCFAIVTPRLVGGLASRRRAACGFRAKRWRGLSRDGTIDCLWRGKGESQSRSERDGKDGAAG
jgi:hypothetical protein